MKTVNALMKSALAAHQKNDLKTARELYEKILSKAPDSMGAAINLSAILLKEGKSVNALLAPFANENAPAELWFNLGLGRAKESDTQNAIIAFENALILNPAFSAAKYELAKLSSDDKAVLLLSEAIKLAPKNEEYWIACANAFAKMGEIEVGINMLSSAFNAGIQSAKVLIQLGLFYWHTNELQKSQEMFLGALEFEPGNTEALWQLSLIRLKIKDFAKGWSGLWVRFHPNKEGGIPFPIANIPVWEGQKVDRLLVVGEQGFGDNIQFARFIPQIDADKIYFAPRKELITLFRASEKIANYAKIIDLDEMPEFDAWIPMMELAALFNVTDKNMPMRDGYLLKPLEIKNIKLRVGLVWQGNPAIARLDSLRSLALKELSKLFDLDNIEFISLQQGYGLEQLEEFRNSVNDGGIFNDFLETAKIIQTLDLVISIDSSVAHLSAALGKPTWILLPYVSCWRWGLDGDTSYWYDCVRLFRQKKPNDWVGVVSDVKEALTHLAK